MNNISNDSHVGVKDKIIERLLEMGLNDNQAKAVFYWVKYELDCAVRREEKLNYPNLHNIEDYDQALREKNNLINDINKILKSTNFDCFYTLEKNGEIRFNPNGFYDNEKNFEEYTRSKFDESLWTFIDERKDIFYEWAYEVYKIADANNYDSETYCKLAKKKFIDEINKFEDNSVTDINLDDNIPYKYLVDNIYSGDKDSFGTKDGWDTTYDVITWIRDDITATLDELREKYGYLYYISYVIDYIIKTVDKIKCPNISREKTLELLIESEKEEPHFEISYKNFLNPYIEAIEEKFNEETEEKNKS